ncbi:hypothetical protein ABZ832_28780 [Streptantibioticus parmotrematis]|uniref:hypothetical protein n=1 Tax=Streptantibioticus parmotrematis TaxID=2873249 RepID=UPI0033FCE026
MSDQSESCGKGEVSEQEWLLVRSRRQALLLAIALVDAPFDAATIQALRSYLDQDADAARAAFEELKARPAQELKARIDELTASHPHVERVGVGKSEVAAAAVRRAAQAGTSVAVLNSHATATFRERS